MLTIGTQGKLAYDLENRLTNLVTATLDNQYEYDGQGVRVCRTVSGTLYQEVPDRGGRLPNILVVKDSEGHPVEYFIWGIGLIAQVTEGSPDTTEYAHGDAQGSTICVKDEDGGVLAAFTYGPYGETLGQSGSTTIPFRWLGGYGITDEGDGFHHMKARFYHAGMKRFVNVDPVGIAGGGNVYAYAVGNPVVLAAAVDIVEWDPAVPWPFRCLGRR